jgi:GLPGLI family protein
MKKRILYYFILLFAQLASFGQIKSFTPKACFVYQLTFQPDSNNNQKSTIDYILATGMGVSYFYDLKMYELDLKLSQQDTGKLLSGDFNQMLNSLPRLKTLQVIEKKGSAIKVYNQVGESAVYYAEEMKPEWKLKPEFNTIMHFEVQKAECRYKGRDYIAWFTKEIPTPDGPYKFQGLPGLIIKITDTRSHFDFEMKQVIENGNLQSFAARTYANPIKIGKSELKTLRENFDRDPFANMEASGKFMDEENKKKVLALKEANRKKNNNPIELAE